jgi:hypothetical protein
MFQNWNELDSTFFQKNKPIDMGLLRCIILGWKVSSSQRASWLLNENMLPKIQMLQEFNYA